MTAKGTANRAVQAAPPVIVNARANPGGVSAPESLAPAPRIMIIAAIMASPFDTRSISGQGIGRRRITRNQILPRSKIQKIVSDAFTEVRQSVLVTDGADGMRKITEIKFNLRSLYLQDKLLHSI